MKSLAFLLCLLSLTTAFAADKVTHVNAEDAAKLIQAGKVTVLDVRTPDEFNEGHIKGAKNIDFNSADFAVTWIVCQLPSGFRTRPRAVSVKCVSRMAISRFFAGPSSTGTSNSTRFERFRLMKSALEIKIAGCPPWRK